MNSCQYLYFADPSLAALTARRPYTTNRAVDDALVKHEIVHDRDLKCLSTFLPSRWRIAEQNALLVACSFDMTVYDV